MRRWWVGLVFGVLLALLPGKSSALNCNLDGQGGIAPTAADVEAFIPLILGTGSSLCANGACDFDGNGQSPNVGDLAKLLAISASGVYQGVCTASLASITLAPASLEVPFDATGTFAATCVYGDGSSRDCTQEVSWSVSPSAQASVSSAGVVSMSTPTASVEVTATLNSISGTGTARVNQRPTLTGVLCTPTSGDAPLSVNCSIQGFSDPNGDPVTCSFDWVDGSAQTLETNCSAASNHVFNAPGTFEVKGWTWDGILSSQFYFTATVTVTTQATGVSWSGSLFVPYQGGYYRTASANSSAILQNPPSNLLAKVSPPSGAIISTRNAEGMSSTPRSASNNSPRIGRQVTDRSSFEKPSRTGQSSGMDGCEISPFKALSVLVKFIRPPTASDLETLRAGKVQVWRPLFDTWYEATLLEGSGDIETCKSLRHSPLVKTTELNGIVSQTYVPNDPYVQNESMWGLEAIHAYRAWDMGIGLYSTSPTDAPVVAVIDSGIVSSHEDLWANLKPGYDFSGSAPDSNPNDDYSDLMASIGKQAGYHGTHVAGTIAAGSGNSKGIAGVCPLCYIVPVKVFNDETASYSDIATAIEWASGLSVPGAPLNPNPAWVINISIATPKSVGYCGYGDNILQDAINNARLNSPTNPAIVVANGNDGLYGKGSGLAACNDVIRAGAINEYGKKPSATDGWPGGPNYTEDMFVLPGTKILSTIGQSSNYGYSQGTSMAAPHLSGIIALMMAKNTNISLSQIYQKLKDSSVDLGPAGQDSAYGWGLVDAYKAVIAAGGVPPTTAAQLLLSEDSVRFDSDDTEYGVVGVNGGTAALLITGVSDNASWLDGAWVIYTDNNGQSYFILNVTVNRSGLGAGTYNAIISITTSAGQVNLPVTMEVSGQLENLGTVFVLAQNPSTFQTVNWTTTNLSAEYAFTIPNIFPGSYYLVAGTDKDSDNIICESQDWCGSWFLPSDQRTVTVETSPLSGYLLGMFPGETAYASRTATGAAPTGVPRTPIKLLQPQPPEKAP